MTDHDGTRPERILGQFDVTVVKRYSVSIVLTRGKQLEQNNSRGKYDTTN